MKNRLSRKQFIEQHGATCRNWNYGWSFINETKKFIIFGAWDKDTEKARARIFSKSWEYSPHRKKRNAGYDLSREHIRLIEEEGYKLFTFPQKFSTSKQDASGRGPARLGGFTPVLTERRLERGSNGRDWYAVDEPRSAKLPQELDPQLLPAGARRMVEVNAYERSAQARAACLKHHGYKCRGCDKTMKEIYGELAQHVIHVHHTKPVGSLPENYRIDPIRELVPVCPNCHAVIHAKRKPLSIKKLRSLLSNRRK